jgi:hypothetical protein
MSDFKVIEDVIQAFEELGFDSLPTNWCSALLDSADLEFDVHVISVARGDGTCQFRMFAYDDDLGEDGIDVLYHAWVKNKKELKRYINKCNGLINGVIDGHATNN